MEGLAAEAGKQFLTQGVLGTLCLILMAVIVFQYRERKACDAARLAELERFIEAREQIAKALAANTLALEANNKASEARTRATEEIANEVEDLRREMGTLRGVIERAILQSGFDVQTLTRLLNELKGNRSGPA